MAYNNRRHWKCCVYSGVLILASGIVYAQSPQPSPDLRLAPQQIEALQALMNLRDAQIKALREDAAKREQDWVEYSKPLWEAPVVAQAPPR